MPGSGPGSRGAAAGSPRPAGFVRERPGRRPRRSEPARRFHPLRTDSSLLEGSVWFAVLGPYLSQLPPNASGGARTPGQLGPLRRVHPGRLGPLRCHVPSERDPRRRAVDRAQHGAPVCGASWTPSSRPVPDFQTSARTSRCRQDMVPKLLTFILFLPS